MYLNFFRGMQSIPQSSASIERTRNCAITNFCLSPNLNNGSQIFLLSLQQMKESKCFYPVCRSVVCLYGLILLDMCWINKACDYETYCTQSSNSYIHFMCSFFTCFLLQYAIYECLVNWSCMSLTRAWDIRLYFLQTYLALSTQTS